MSHRVEAREKTSARIQAFSNKRHKKFMLIINSSGKAWFLTKPHPHCVEIYLSTNHASWLN